MNISIDDTSPNFVWSTGADDWRVQAPNQVSINSGYFLQSYHATQTKGANVAITFIGQFLSLLGPICSSFIFFKQVLLSRFMDLKVCFHYHYSSLLHTMGLEARTSLLPNMGPPPFNQTSVVLIRLVPIQVQTMEIIL